MLKITVLLCCLCASIFYYSILKPKGDKKDIEMTMEILKVIEENNIDKDSIGNLLDCSYVSNKVKLDVKTHLLLGLNYSKYKRMAYGEYERQ